MTVDDSNRAPAALTQYGVPAATASASTRVGAVPHGLHACDLPTLPWVRRACCPNVWCSFQTGLCDHRSAATRGDWAVRRADTRPLPTQGGGDTRHGHRSGRGLASVITSLREARPSPVGDDCARCRQRRVCLAQRCACVCTCVCACAHVSSNKRMLAGVAERDNRKQVCPALPSSPQHTHTHTGRPSSKRSSTTGRTTGTASMASDLVTEVERRSGTSVGQPAAAPAAARAKRQRRCRRWKALPTWPSSSKC